MTNDESEVTSMKTEWVSERNTSRVNSTTDGNKEEHERVAPNDVIKHKLCAVYRWWGTLPPWKWESF